MIGSLRALGAIWLVLVVLTLVSAEMAGGWAAPAFAFPLVMTMTTAKALAVAGWYMDLLSARLAWKFAFGLLLAGAALVLALLHLAGMN